MRLLAHIRLLGHEDDSHLEIDQGTRDRLRHWLWQDYVLYDYFREKLEARSKSIDNIREEKSKMDDARQKIMAECQIEKKLNKDLTGKQRHKFASEDMVGYSVGSNDEYCQTFGLNEKAFVELLRNKML